MGLGIRPEDLDMDEKIIFDKGSTTTFMCMDTHENVEKESIILKCKVLDGPHEGKFHNIYLSTKRAHTIQIRKLRDFAKAFYTEAELRSGEQPLSRLYARKFQATAMEAKEHNGRWYQDLTAWKDLGEASEDTSPTTSGGTTTASKAATESSEIPF